MSARPKSPDSRDSQYRLRISSDEIERLNYCCNILKLTKADVIRQGIYKMYEEAQKRTNK